MRHRCLAAVVAALLAAPPTVWAQSPATLTGVVTDAQQAAIPGVAVLLRQPASGLERVATTDATGHFTLPNLPAGTHEVAASLDGFASATARVVLTPGFLSLTDAGNPFTTRSGSLPAIRSQSDELMCPLALLASRSSRHLRRLDRSSSEIRFGRTRTLPRAQSSSDDIAYELGPSSRP